MTRGQNAFSKDSFKKEKESDKIQHLKDLIG